MALAGARSESRSTSLESSDIRMGKWDGRKDNHDEFPLLLHDVVKDQWGNNTDPQARGFNNQIAQGLAELRVDAQSPVDLAQRGEELWARAGFRRTKSRSASMTRPE
jgi:hypothetical protein